MRLYNDVFYPKSTIDISALVNLDDGKDLMTAKLEQADTKTLKELSMLSPTSVPAFGQLLAEWCSVLCVVGCLLLVWVLAAELSAKADRLRKHEDTDFNKSKPLIKAMPVFVLRWVVWLTGFLSSSLGLNIAGLGVK